MAESFGDSVAGPAGLRAAFAFSREALASADVVTGVVGSDDRGEGRRPLQGSWPPLRLSTFKQRTTTRH